MNLEYLVNLIKESENNVSRSSREHESNYSFLVIYKLIISLRDYVIVEKY